MTDQPRRVNFFPGLLLSVADLAEEQTYHREMRHLHNRLHGHGTVSGLEVEVTPDGVHVSAGTGIDVLGRELVVADPLTVPCEKPGEDDQSWVRDVVLTWQEVPESPTPLPDGTVAFSRWVEQPALALVAQDTAAPEALVLARLMRTDSGEVAVDTTVRRPLSRDDGAADHT
jgi:hypothetical protein